MKENNGIKSFLKEELYPQTNVEFYQGNVYKGDRSTGGKVDPQRSKPFATIDDWLNSLDKKEKEIIKNAMLMRGKSEGYDFTKLDKTDIDKFIKDYIKLFLNNKLDDKFDINWSKYKDTQSLNDLIQAKECFNFKNPKSIKFKILKEELWNPVIIFEKLKKMFDFIGLNYKMFEEDPEPGKKPRKGFLFKNIKVAIIVGNTIEEGIQIITDTKNTGDEEEIQESKVLTMNSVKGVLDFIKEMLFDKAFDIL